VIGCHARHGNPLLPAPLAADDSHGAAGDAQAIGEHLDQRVVRGAFDRRRRQSYQQRAIARASDLVFPGSGDDPDG